MARRLTIFGRLAFKTADSASRAAVFYDMLRRLAERQPRSALPSAIQLAETRERAPLTTRPGRFGSRRQ
jgi:hypothetical protein